MGHVAYFRVSTRKQGKSGYGLGSQRAIVCHFVDCAGLVAEFTEIGSGKDIAGRPKLQEAIKLCQAGGHHLVVAKVDRLSRKTEDALAIYAELGGRLIACDIPMMDKFTLTIFMAIADRERELNRIRTKAGIAEKRKREPDWQPGSPDNLTENGRAKGVATVKKKAINDYQQTAGYCQLLRDNGLSFAAIAERLNDEGFTTRRGKSFKPMTVKRILDRVS